MKTKTSAPQMQTKEVLLWAQRLEKQKGHLVCKRIFLDVPGFPEGLLEVSDLCYGSEMSHIPVCCFIVILSLPSFCSRFSCLPDGTKYKLNKISS